MQEFIEESSVSEHNKKSWPALTIPTKFSDFLKKIFKAKKNDIQENEDLLNNDDIFEQYAAADDVEENRHAWKTYQYFTEDGLSNILNFLKSIKQNKSSLKLPYESSQIDQALIEQLWNENQWDSVIENLYASSQDNKIILPYLKRIDDEIVSNSAFILSLQSQNMLMEMLIKVNSPETIQVLENLLLSIHFISPSLPEKQPLFNTAIFQLIFEHGKTGHSADDWIANFFYSYLLIHPDSFAHSNINLTPLGVIEEREDVIRDIVGKMFDDAGVYQARKRDEVCKTRMNKLISFISRYIRKKPNEIFTVPDALIRIFRRFNDIDVDRLALIIYRVSDSSYLSVNYLEGYVAFAITQFDAAEDIDERSLERKNLTRDYSIFITHNQVMENLTHPEYSQGNPNSIIGMNANLEQKYETFGKNAGTLCQNSGNHEVFNDFLSVCAIIGEDERKKQIASFISALLSGISISNIAQLIETHPIDEGDLSEFVSFVVRLPKICSKLQLTEQRLTAFIQELFNKNDLFDLLVIFDYLDSEETAFALQDWLSNPRIVAAGIILPEKILSAIYNYWSIKDVFEISDTLTLCFNLPDDMPVQWGSFDFSKKISNSDKFVIQDVATSEELVEYREYMHVFALDKQCNALTLMNSLLGYREFIENIKSGKVDTLSNIRSIDLISYIEPNWFSIVIDALRDRLIATEGFIDIQEQIELMVAEFKKGNRIDGNDGLWRHRCVLRRDGSMIEDQTIYIVLRMNQDQPQISIEFKLTEPSVVITEPRMSEISEFKRWNNDGIDGTANAQINLKRLLKLKTQLEKAAQYCSSCNTYHPNNDHEEYLPISHVENLGFTQQEYVDLLAMNNEPQIIKNNVGEKGIKYSSTPTARSKFGSNDATIVEATAEFQPEAQTLVASVGSSSRLRAYHGTITVTLDMTPPYDPQYLTLRLFGVLNMMGLEEALRPVDEASRRKLAINRYKWSRKLESNQPEDEYVDRLKLKDVFMGYQTFVDEGFHRQLERAGLVFLYSTMKTADGVAGAFDVGLLSGNQRRLMGIIRGGWSTDSDIQKGGSDYAFLRAATEGGVQDDENLGSYNHNYLVIWDTEVTDRTDWFAQHSDMFGSTKKEEFDQRQDPITFVMGEQENPNFNNEVCIKKGVSSRHLAFVITQTEEGRRELIEKLKQRGITRHRGLPIEECIIHHETRKSEYGERVWKSGLSQRALELYAIMMRKYEARSTAADKR